MSSTAIAGLFPGQGSHTGEMREHVELVVPELLEQCCKLVGEDPFPRVAESTRFAQPAIFCASLAGWYELRAQQRPTVLAGHSLGELAALVAAEALDPLAGLTLAVRRGELMGSVVGHDDGMLALLGADEALVGALAAEAGVALANDNAPGQVVLAGPLSRLRAASARARESGARAIVLDVAGAFHSPAMAPAVEPFRAALEGVEFHPPAIPVLCGSRAGAFHDVRADLAAAIVEPVRWRATMLALARRGVTVFADFGPGAVLARLARRICSDATVLDLNSLRSARPGETSSVA